VYHAPFCFIIISISSGSRKTILKNHGLDVARQLEKAIEGVLGCTEDHKAPEKEIFYKNSDFIK